MHFSGKLLVACLLILSSCAPLPKTPPVNLAGGERINIDYTCRLPDGSLAATSRKEVADDKAISKSPIFKELSVYLPADQCVPQPKTYPSLTSTMSFEEMLEVLLAHEALGAPINQLMTLTISGGLIPGIEGENRYLTLNRSYKRPRQITIPISKFEMSQKTSPVLGKEIKPSKSSGMKAVVSAIDGNVVTLTYSAEPGTVSTSFFGPETINQTADFLEIITYPQLNTILRSGGAIGKITEVNDKTYVVDYGHSFGFTPLTCEVMYSPFTSTDGLNWQHNLTSAKEESSKSGKPLFLHFHDQWSGPSRTFLNEILPNPKVLSAMNGFVRVRINGREHPELLKQYDVSTMPSVLIFDNHNNLLNKFSGTPEIDNLTTALQLIQFSKKEMP
jgi:hypothetical protein